MGRGSRSGPATGGQFVIPLWAKRAASGVRVESGCMVPVAARLVQVFSHNTGSASDFVVRIAGTDVMAQQTATVHVSKAAQASAVGEGKAFTEDTARNAARLAVVDLEVQGGSAGKLDISAHCLFAARGFTTDDESDD